MLPEPISATTLVTKILEQLNIPYLIGGSLASTIYGIVRTTPNVDIIADMSLSQIQPFVEALKSEFYLDEDMIVDAVTHQSSFNIIHQPSMFKVDVFIPPQSPFQQSEYSRARKQIIVSQPEISAFFSSPEDTILAKLDWFHKGNEVSERQGRDIIGILKVKEGDLDLDYLRKWARELNLENLLERALKESA
jgi:hypothetical protein